MVRTLLKLSLVNLSLLVGCLGVPPIALAQETLVPASLSLRPDTSCPEDISQLTELLTRDLPSYTNRVLQRSLGEIRTDFSTPALDQYRPAHVLLAGQTELVPLDITDRVYTTSPTAGDSLAQIFFTTLEREYSGTRAITLQHLHWAFLTPSETGWRLAFMFSTLDDPTQPDPILPPRESTLGSIGQAVKLWLRDCRTGNIYPEIVESDEFEPIELP
ncbi:MAG: hypothetical protein AAF921_05555 [Cyanobacteria bacterium P01_D01_bin.44]